MGMDVYGKAATSEAGEYFRRNVWGWHPLWEYVQSQHPDIADLVDNGHSNDGDGLDDAASRELAQRLRHDLETGAAWEYVARRNAMLNALPRRKCEICDGTGQRPDGLFGIEWKQSGCNGCEGVGTAPDFATYYYLDTDDIKDFAEFLEACGGFEIW